MSRRVLGICVVTAIGMGGLSQALGAGVSELPQDQRRAAECMASVLKSIPEATRAGIRISDIGGRHIFLDYDFKHHWREYGVSHEQVDITEIVTHPDQPHGMHYGGLFTPGKITVDDADSGMPRIGKFWRVKCGLILWETVG
jgi:hypothetical protein